MKKLLQLTLILVLISNIGKSQTKDMPWQLGLGIGIGEYNGDLGNGFFKFDFTRHDLSANGGSNNKNTGLMNYFTVSRYLNEEFDVAFRFHSGEFGYYKGANTTTGTVLNNFYRQATGIELTPRWKFLRKDDAMFTPYITAGIGMRRINMPKQDANYGFLDMDKRGLYEFTVPAGLGVNIKVYKQIGVNIQSNFLWTNNDKIEGRPELEEFSYDQAWYHTIGITYNLGKIVDTDGDGVSDKKDKCPNTPSGDLVNPTTGCSIDTDKDGIADNKDQCPLIAGIASFKGCPDSDNDGIQDSEDKCPTVAGVVGFKGCPDSDNDGIQDSEDKCPTEAGIAQFQGCPDTDGDGIQDSEDACPTKKGIASFKGCPDTDNDGIEDKLDKCPTVPGVSTNNGCPEVKAEVKKLFEQALQGVQFESGKSVLKPTSFAILNNVVKIMKDNPTYRLYISGHTDNAGVATKNLTLSTERAAAVEKYLESKGIETSRVRSEGFGDTMPVADNATKDGKAKNRRVEFKVEFEQ